MLIYGNYSITAEKQLLGGSLRVGVTIAQK